MDVLHVSESVYMICACVRGRVRVCACICVCVCVWLCLWLCLWLCVFPCVFDMPSARTAYGGNTLHSEQGHARGWFIFIHDCEWARTEEFPMKEIANKGIKYSQVHLVVACLYWHLHVHAYKLAIKTACLQSIHNHVRTHLHACSPHSANLSRTHSKKPSPSLQDFALHSQLPIFEWQSWQIWGGYD